MSAPTPLRTPSVADVIAEGNASIIDARPIAAFNGWPWRGEMRGGHLPGAIPFPRTWLDESDPRFEAKGIDGTRPVLVYGHDRDDGWAAAERFAELGFGDVMVYDDGAHVWASDTKRPMQRMPRYRQLVHPGWLAKRIETQRRVLVDDQAIDDGFVLLHAHFDNPDDFHEGHVEGALPMDTLDLEEPERWNRRAPGEIQRALTSRGIGRDTTVVVYGRTGAPDMSQDHPGKEAGQLAAMRVAILAMYAGVRDVRVLDGGLNAWIAAGHPVTTEAAEPHPIASFGTTVPARPELVVDIDEAREMLAGQASELVSVRSWAEFIGEVSGYHYVKPKGRIPGAVFGNCGSDAYHMQNYRNGDNTVRCYHEIEAKWREMGITPDKRVAFYCGTGWRASEACFCAHLLGWNQIAIYDGGWFEWSIDDENPLETGVPDTVPAGFANT